MVTITGEQRSLQEKVIAHLFYRCQGETWQSKKISPESPSRQLPGPGRELRLLGGPVPTTRQCPVLDHFQETEAGQKNLMYVSMRTGVSRESYTSSKSSK